MNQKFTKGAALSLALLMGGHAGFAQLSGIKTIPGSGANTYPSLTAAIADLNAQGVGAGGVTFNIAANYTETLTAPLAMTVLATGTTANPIIFQKSGSGANPVITAYTGGTGTSVNGTPDGVWNLQGSDYVTINGINIQENAANTTAATMMEYGFGLFKADASNGCQNNTIMNCVITLNKSNVTNAYAANNLQPSILDGSIGILTSGGSITAATTPITSVAASGANSFNKFYSNTIQNTNIGVGLCGFADATPFTNADQGNDVGGSTAGTGNAILNFGGGTSGSVNTDTLVSGIYALNQYDLNASYNTINSNNGSGVTHNTSIHGIFTRGGDNANMNINKNTITLARNISVTSTTFQRLVAIENAAGANGTSNTVNINENLITNCRDTATTTPTSAAFYGIWNRSAAYNLNVRKNTFSNDTTYLNAGTFIMFANGGAVVNNLLVDSNDISNIYFKCLAATTAQDVRFMINSSDMAGPLCTTSYTNNRFHDITAAIPFTGGYFEGIDVNAVGQTTTTSMSGNKMYNINVVKSGAAGSGVTGFVHGNRNGTNNIVLIQNNSIENVNITAGATAVYTVLGIGGINRTPATETGTVIMSGNTVRNLNNNGTGILNAISYTGATSGSLQTLQISNNTVDSLTINSSANASLISGIIVTGGISGSYVSNNTVKRIVSNSATSGHVINGIQFGGGSTGFNVNNNLVDSIYSGLGAIGINQTSTCGSMNYFKNKINNLSGLGASSSVFGIQLSGGVASTNFSISNNVIGNLTAPVATATTDRICGINLPTSITSSTVNVSNNTIYLNATAGGANFSTAGIYHLASSTATSLKLILRNNVIVNNSIANGTGKAAAIKRSASGLTGNFDVSSDNNLLQASTIYSDGANFYNTIADYHNAFVQQGAHTVAGNPTFLSTTGSSPDFLRPSPIVATAIESGGRPVAGVTDDYNGTVRDASYPDLGAYEGNYSINDITAPLITFNTLNDTTATANFSVTLNADISDKSNVNTAASSKPRLYFKKKANADAFLGNTAADNGWKYVEANNAVTPFNFTIDYSLLQGGTVSGGDTIQYFVVAQDMATTPNAGPNNSIIFPATPSSVALGIAQNNVGGTINSYRIVSQLSGNVTVGTSGTYNSLTNTGGLFDAINSGFVTGNITATIISDLNAETGAVSLNQWTETGVGNYTLSIVPDGTTERVISGTATPGLITLNGADRVTIDGSFGGSGKYLKFNNASTTNAASTIALLADAQNNKVTNCTIEGATTATFSTTAQTGAVVFIGAGSTSGNDNNSFIGNKIKDATTVPTFLLRNASTSAALSNDNIFVYNNEFLNFSTTGLLLGNATSNATTNGGTGWIIRKNAFYQTANRTTALTCVQLATGNNNTVDSNNIGGKHSK